MRRWTQRGAAAPLRSISAACRGGGRRAGGAGQLPPGTAGSTFRWRPGVAVASGASVVLETTHLRFRFVAAPFSALSPFRVSAIPSPRAHSFVAFPCFRGSVINFVFQPAASGARVSRTAPREMSRENRAPCARRSSLRFRVPRHSRVRPCRARPPTFPPRE